MYDGNGSTSHSLELKQNHEVASGWSNWAQTDKPDPFTLNRLPEEELGHESMDLSLRCTILAGNTDSN